MLDGVLRAHCDDSLDRTNGLDRLCLVVLLLVPLFRRQQVRSRFFKAVYPKAPNKNLLESGSHVAGVNGQTLCGLPLGGTSNREHMDCAACLAARTGK